MTAKTVLDQKIGQAAAAAAFSKSLLLESTHHTRGQCDVEPFRFSSFSNLRCCDIGCSDITRFTLQLMLQFFQEALQE